MKRNETVLVYAVTALLLVILLVAVLFGNQPANAKSDPDKTAQLPGVMKALTEEEGDDTSPGSGATTDLENNDTGDSDAGNRDTDGKAGPPGTRPSDVSEAGKTADPSVVADGTGTGDPNGTPAVETGQGTTAPLSARVDLPAQRLERMFGASERRGDYRLVKAWDGATLHNVVERWCGSTDPVQDVRFLNEHIGSAVRAGDEVLVPWVDAETLLTAHDTLAAERKKIDWAKGELYKLKKGDSLWKVASRRVATNKIPAWLEQFKSLNPEISDLDALVEGQSVRLPR